MTIKSMLAQREIFEKLKSDNNSYIDFFDSRIDINNDLETSSTKIVFNENCYLKMKNLIQQVISSKTEERGTIFYGRLKDNIILIDYYESDLELSKGLFDNAAVTMTEQNIEEIKKLTNKEKGNIYDVVVHYHVHPSYVLTKNGIRDNNINGLKISDQDLFTYGWLKINIKPESEDEILYLGAVSSVNYGIKPQLKIVTCNQQEEKFIRFEDVYYYQDSQLFKFDLNDTNNNIIDNNKMLVNRLKSDF